MRQVEERIRAIDVDALLSVADIEEYIVDSRRTVFPQVVFTELPDRFCRGLMDYRVGMLVDGFPWAACCPAI